MARRRPTIADLVTAGRIERIQADADEAQELLRHARAHLASARKLCDDDPAGAYQLLYDAARKATAADMLASGYRARSDRPGAHAAVVIYAEEALAGEGDERAIASFDRMRRTRNRAEYGAAVIGRAQLHADLEHAHEIVRTATARMDARTARSSS
jgi:hypothetical protein